MEEEDVGAPSLCSEAESSKVQVVRYQWDRTFEADRTGIWSFIRRDAPDTPGECSVRQREKTARRRQIGPAFIKRAKTQHDDTSGGDAELHVGGIEDAGGCEIGPLQRSVEVLPDAALFEVLLVVGEQDLRSWATAALTCKHWRDLCKLVAPSISTIDSSRNLTARALKHVCGLMSATPLSLLLANVLRTFSNLQTLRLEGHSQQNHACLLPALASGAPSLRRLCLGPVFLFNPEQVLGLSSLLLSLTELRAAPFHDDLTGKMLHGLPRSQADEAEMQMVLESGVRGSEHGVALRMTSLIMHSGLRPRTTLQALNPILARLPQLTTLWLSQYPVLAGPRGAAPSYAGAAQDSSPALAAASTAAQTVKWVGQCYEAPSEEILKSVNVTLLKLAAACPALEYLALLGVPLSATALRALGSGCPKLRRVVGLDLSHVSREAVATFLQALPTDSRVERSSRVAVFTICFCGDFCLLQEQPPACLSRWISAFRIEVGCGNAPGKSGFDGRSAGMSPTFFDLAVSDDASGLGGGGEGGGGEGGGLAVARGIVMSRSSNL
ncbi:hypothetical protein CYMTET_38707 [Cymbomonas tetramitiformis]|uniref:F-box domain-containing protein n=1 Tax=Cymbomonas tetramitiformis TaxID=36881 RepID=A0AAE0F501_9CHLO|nr:hypothetical protein CYMTET_38707 [Cymbomonas tetramitiformis]